MNDFTKEQLETMRNAIFWGMVSSSVWRIGKDYPAEKCMKCGAMWE